MVSTLLEWTEWTQTWGVSKEMLLKARGQAEPQGSLCEGEGDPRKENEKG